VIQVREQGQDLDQEDQERAGSHSQDPHAGPGENPGQYHLAEDDGNIRDHIPVLDLHRGGEWDQEVRGEEDQKVCGKEDQEVHVKQDQEVGEEDQEVRGEQDQEVHGEQDLYLGLQ